MLGSFYTDIHNCFFSYSFFSDYKNVKNLVSMIKNAERFIIYIYKLHFKIHYLLLMILLTNFNTNASLKIYTYTTNEDQFLKLLKKLLLSFIQPFLFINCKSYNFCTSCIKECKAKHSIYFVIKKEMYTA